MWIQLQKEDKTKENAGNKLSILGGGKRLYKRGQAVNNRQGAGNHSRTQSHTSNKNICAQQFKKKKKRQPGREM